MKIAIMQPYFFPYAGYYNLLAQVDKFVIYDDIQFTKKGWINRNYLNSLSGPWLFSIPVTNVSAIEIIGQKQIAPEYDRLKLISRIEQNYKRLATPEKLTQVKKMINFSTDSLFKYIHFSLIEMSKEIGIDPEKIIPSSVLGDFTDYKGQEKVIQICKSLSADVYINPIGGKALYSTNTFEESGILLRFQEPIETTSQNQHEEIPYLSFLHDYLTLSSVELRNVVFK
jgi:hypothetical protein